MAEKYWEIIADQLRAAGWSLGWCSFYDGDGRKMFSADAHKDDGRRFVVHAENLAVALDELQRQTRADG